MITMLRIDRADQPMIGEESKKEEAVVVRLWLMRNRTRLSNKHTIVHSCHMAKIDSDDSDDDDDDDDGSE